MRCLDEDGAGRGEKSEGDENEKLADVSRNLLESSKFRNSDSSGAHDAATPPQLSTQSASATRGSQQKAMAATSGPVSSGTDVRLPPFVRKQLDAIRDATTADDLLVAEEKLHVLVPNETKRNV